MEYLGILGFAISGFLLPELCLLFSDNGMEINMPFNLASALSAGLISASFLIN